MMNLLLLTIKSTGLANNKLKYYQKLLNQKITKKDNYSK